MRMESTEAKKQIIVEFDNWIRSKSLVELALSRSRARKDDAFEFYSWLQEERPDLLTFEDDGDRWPTMHWWLIYARRVLG